MSLIRLLDISGIFWPLWRAKEAQRRPIGEASEETIATLRRIAARSDAQHVVACCDTGRSFRHAFAEEYRASAPDYPGYKGHRPEKDPAMMAALNLVIDELEQDGVPILRASGFEADDVIATVTTWATAQGHDVEIVSEDKDLLSLVRDPEQNNEQAPCVVVERRDGTRQDANACIARLGVPPELVPHFLALQGDASDGVLGIPEVGKKTASALLWGEMVDGQWKKTPYRRFDDIVSAAVEDQVSWEQHACYRAHEGAAKGATHDVIAKRLGITIEDVAAYLAKPKPEKIDYRATFAKDVRQNLIRYAARFEISLRLTTLRTDVPLDFAQVTAPRVPKPKQTTFDPALVAAFETTGETMPTVQDAEISTPSSQTPANDPGITPPSQVASAPALVTPPTQIEVTAAPAKPDATLAVVQTQAMAATGPSREFERQLEPSNFVQAVKLAEAIAASRKLKDMTDKNEVLLQMVMGRSIGLNLFQALCLFYIVEGKGAMAAQLVAARVRQHPQCEYFRKRSGDKTQATWESKAKGDPRVTTWTFTIQDAKDARLGGCDKNPQGQFDPKSNWAKYPAQMCSWRAVMFLAREEWPEITAGIYDPDEIREQREAPSMEDAA